MATNISVDFAKLSTVSAQATALGRKMDATKDELIALQLQLRETQNYLEKHYETCWDMVVPIKRLRRQSEKINSVVSVLSTTDALAKDVENKLKAPINMLKLLVATSSFMFSTAMSVIAGNLTGETDCGNGWCGVGNSFTPRTQPPTSDNEYYGDKATKANCTTYAANRAREILQDPDLSFQGDAKEWWKYKDSFAGYSTDSSEPRIGALMIWGKEGFAGPGHVAVVEDIIYNNDGSVKTVIYSESAWGGLWYNGEKKQLYGQYNWYGNATSYWGCAGQTPDQIEKVTQTVNKEKVQMGFVGYIYLQ